VCSCFFFQAEDGIRDLYVTGVQTCALPISGVVKRIAAAERAGMLGNDAAVLADHNAIGVGMDLDRTSDRAGCHRVFVVIEAHERSEERRVGKECSFRWRAFVCMLESK